MAVNADGNVLVYTDGPLGVLGIVDIEDPSAPAPLGNVDLDGEPTSVTIVDNLVLVAVNTSTSYTQPSGYLAVIDLETLSEVRRLDLGG